MSKTLSQSESIAVTEFTERGLLCRKRVEELYRQLVQILCQDPQLGVQANLRVELNNLHYDLRLNSLGEWSDEIGTFFDPNNVCLPEQLMISVGKNLLPQLGQLYWKYVDETFHDKRAKVALLTYENGTESVIFQNRIELFEALERALEAAINDFNYLR